MVRLILALGVMVGKPFSAEWVTLAIIVGIITDIADGYVARRLRVVSNIGFMLDSIADIVCFGVLLFFYLLIVVPSSSFVAVTLLTYSLGRTSWRNAKQWGPPLPVIGVTATIAAQLLGLWASLTVLLAAILIWFCEITLEFAYFNRIFQVLREGTYVTMALKRKDEDCE